MGGCTRPCGVIGQGGRQGQGAEGTASPRATHAPRTCRHSPKHFPVDKSVPAPHVSRHPSHTERHGCGRGQGKVISIPLGQEKEAIKNQSTCWSAAILGHRRGGRVRRGPHGGGEHPWGQEHREGDPAGAAPAGKKGGEVGAVLGAGEPLREPPPPCSSGNQGGLGAGAGRAPSTG